MPTTVVDDAAKILEFLYRADPESQLDGAAVAEGTGLTPQQINDAVTILVENGYAEWLRFLGTRPYAFGNVEITARGRYEYERAQAQAAADEMLPAHRSGSGAPMITRPQVPIGSPYGFGDEDWELVAERKGAADRLNVVLGYQFRSNYYNSDDLRRNLEQAFNDAVVAYRELPNAVPATLSFRALSAGYGEHLFNEIARDIISADIAVFETSDLNPNVMLELGVALTWGIRVLVVKSEGRPQPPSDVSGQTWADYRDSAREFADSGHPEKLVRMVERAIRKKARR